MENLSKVFLDKHRKKDLRRLSFKTQFMVEFLLLLTGCRKMLGQKPGYTDTIDMQ